LTSKISSGSEVTINGENVLGSIGFENFTEIILFEKMSLVLPRKTNLLSILKTFIGPYVLNTKD
jgi:hypothetical protein